MARRILILAAGVGSGHNQAAQAVEAGLRAAGESDIHRIDILETTNPVFTSIYDDAYFTLVQQVPWLVGWGYDNQDPPFKLAPVAKWWDELNTIATVRQIADLEPDVVICTHFLPARLVSLMLARGQLKAALTVVATDYDFQGLWLTTPFTHFFVARQETRRHMIALGVPADRLSVSGIPVRAELGEEVDREAALRRFSLDGTRPVVLISAGAAGGAYAEQIVRQVLAMAVPFQAVVVCGRNAELRASVEQLAQGREADVRVLGYTTEMADLMRVASVFVGKPGGLSSSECMAAGLPMLIVNPIPGQEVRNADYLLEEGAALRCNYPTTIGFKLERLLGDPARLASMAAQARRIGFPGAGAQVAAESLAGTRPPLWISRDAQRSMGLAGTEGVGVVDLPAERQLRTLIDPESGDSLAVLTHGQLAPLGFTAQVGEVELSLTRMNALRWLAESVDLAITVKWLLSGAPNRTVGVR